MNAEFFPHRNSQENMDSSDSILKPFYLLRRGYSNAFAGVLPSLLSLLQLSFVDILLSLSGGVGFSSSFFLIASGSVVTTVYTPQQKMHPIATRAKHPAVRWEIQDGGWNYNLTLSRACPPESCVSTSCHLL